MPAKLRPAVMALYAFARHADDLADEGEFSPEERLTALAAMDAALLAGPHAAHANPPATVGEGIVRRLWPFIEQHGLPLPLLRNLLSAFVQDVRVNRYVDRAQLLDYCARSANPVGRLMLRLFSADTTENGVLSDHICTALQLINFLQDVAIDHAKGRIYLPQQALQRAGMTDSDIARACLSGQAMPALRQVIADESEFARTLLVQGAPLTRNLGFRLGLEMRAIIAGGMRILQRLGQGGFDPLSARPTLSARDAPAMLWLALRMPQ